MSASTRGRRPGPSTTHEEILEAAKECLIEFGYEKSTLRRIALRAGVSDSLLIHQFGTRDNLLAEALTAPKGLDKIINIMRKFPRSMWGRVIAEGIHRGELRNPEGRESLTLLLRASAQSEASAQFVTRWVSEVLTEEIRALGVSNPELRARAFATVMFGTTFTNEILELDVLDKKTQRIQEKIRGRVLQVILAEDF